MNNENRSGEYTEYGTRRDTNGEYHYTNRTQEFVHERYGEAGRKQNKKQESDWLSWVVIGAMFLGGAWFVGIPLLFIKLFGKDAQEKRQQAPTLNRRETAEEVRRSVAQEMQREKQQRQRVRKTVDNMTKTPKVSKGGGLGLIIGGVFVALMGIAIMTDVNAADALSDILFTALFGASWVVGGGAMAFFGYNNRQAEKRLPRYLAVIGKNEAVHIATIAKKLGVKEKVARKDLQKLIDRGAFGAAAYINEELGYLFVSSKADDELQAARDRAEAMTAEAKAEQAKKAESDQVDAYAALVRQIRDVNDRIAHKEMTEKIYRLEEITREIFRTVQESPEKRGKIDKFMTYYLPTTLKLLESYARLEKTGVEGDNISQSRETIEAAMDNIVDGFKNQLDDLYKSDVLDIETDIDVMTKLMGRENPESDFKKVAKKPAKAEPADTRTQFQKDFGLESATASTPYATGAVRPGQTATGAGAAQSAPQGGSAVEYK